MHLTDMLKLRATIGSVVFLSLTQRCPLKCRHCCTGSLMSSEQHEATIFSEFVDTFTAESHPEVVSLTGGEALLRPALVARITERVHAVGGKVALISGMYFLRNKAVPPAVQRAIDGVDLFTASLDAFHEEEVPREAVLTYLARLLDQGKDVSLQLVGLSDDDPYLEQATADAIRVTGGRMPILVAHLGPVGRGKDLFEATDTGLVHQFGLVDPVPCQMSAWPVVSYDGSVYGCCVQDVIDAKGPEHLRIAHASDGWPVLLERYRSRPYMRAVRVIGPRAIAQKIGAPVTAQYCGTCRSIPDTPENAAAIEELTSSPSFVRIETVVRRMSEERVFDAVVKRHASHRYAELIHLGEKGKQPVETTSSLLRARARLLLGALRPRIEEFWASPDPARSYADYLVMLHQVVRASVPLMEHALERARSLQGDPVAAALIPYLEHHIPEERGHDRWLIEDLTEIDPALVLETERMPSPAVAEMIGAQYYWLEHHHPSTVLGYIQFAEGNPPTEAGIERLRGLTGLPRQAFRTVRRHAVIDQRHRADLFAFIDSLALTEQQVAALSTAATHASTAYIRIYRDLQRRADERAAREPALAAG
jgi:pyruvate-formate lyase-activating enzyme